MTPFEEVLERIGITLAEWDGIKFEHNLTDELIEEGKEILRNAKDAK
jgi:hypothetical protein